MIRFDAKAIADRRTAGIEIFDPGFSRDLGLISPWSRLVETPLHSKPLCKGFPQRQSAAHAQLRLTFAQIIQIAI